MAVRARQRATAGVAVRVPAWALVAGVVALSTVAYFLLGRRIPAPWILTDELVYSEAAKSFAGTGSVLIRDQSWQQPGPIYPMLISPAWALFKAVPDAYAAAKIINAFMISSAAVPAYLLGRRVLSQPFALAGALLSVAVPSMLYSGTIMTENAFYPLFLATTLALVLALERPTIARSILLLGLFVLAFLARAQAVALIPAILTAPILLVLLQRRGLRALKAYWPFCAVTALIVLPAVAVQLAHGRSVTDLFGRYSVVGEARYPLGSVAKWFVYHVAELDLYLGILPLAAVVLLVVFFRGLTERQQAFTAATIALSFWLLLVAAAVSQTYAFVHRVEERNMFYVAPLLLIGLLLWIDRGLPRARWATGGVALVAAALPAVLPLHSLLNSSIVSDTLALIPWLRLDLSFGAAARWTQVLLVLSCLAWGVLLFVPARFRLIIPGLLLAYFVTVTIFAAREWRGTSSGIRAALGAREPDWIDRTVRGGSSVAVVYAGHTFPVAIWDTEFFNRTVGPVYYLGQPTPGGLPETRVSAETRTGALRDPHPVAAQYGLSGATATLAGKPVAKNGPLTLYRTPGALRLRTLVQGLYPGDLWSGATASYTRYSCSGGRIAVGLTGAATTKKTVIARTTGRFFAVRVPPLRALTLRLPLLPRGGACRIAFRVQPAPTLSIPPGAPLRPWGVKFIFP